MKRITNFLISLMALIVLAGCNKNENQSPRCIIDSPVEGDTFHKGDTIVIESTASDEDGEIKEIKLMINGIGSTFVSNSELHYEWMTENETTGDYVISVVAIDNDNNESNTQVNIQITEKVELAILSLDSIINVTDSSAQVCCSVTHNGNSVLDEVGVCWSKEEGVTIDDNKCTLIEAKKSFCCNISELESNTKYYFRAYASNSVGLAYSDEISITTNEDLGSILTSTMTDARDSQSYNTVKIGNYWWFAENLSYHSKKSLFYQNDSSEYQEYGRLYSYEEANEACPEGWHLPSDNEWKDLEKAMGMTDDEVSREEWRGDGIATKLKMGGGSQFEAKLGGYATDDGHFADLGLGYWWTSSMKDSEHFWFRSMSTYYTNVERYAYTDSYYFSVRCLKD